MSESSEPNLEPLKKLTFAQVRENVGLLIAAISQAVPTEHYIVRVDDYATYNNVNNLDIGDVTLPLQGEVRYTFFDTRGAPGMVICSELNRLVDSAPNYKEALLLYCDIQDTKDRYASDSHDALVLSIEEDASKGKVYDDDYSGMGPVQASMEADEVRNILDCLGSYVLRRATHNFKEKIRRPYDAALHQYLIDESARREPTQQLIFKPQNVNGIIQPSASAFTKLLKDEIARAK